MVSADSRRRPASSLNLASLFSVEDRRPRLSSSSIGAGTGSGTGEGACPPLEGSTSSFFFAFLRIFTKSTMGVLHAMLASGGIDSGGIDGLGVFSESVEQRGGGERIDQARNAAAD